MKLIRYMAAFCLPLFALTACDTDIEHVVFDSTTATPAVLSISGTAQNVYVLDATNASSEVFTVNWTAPDMGVSVAVTNVLQMDFEGKNFANAQTLATVTERTVTSYTAVTSELNGYLQTLLGRYDMETPTTEEDALTVNLRLVSYITSSQSDSLFSDVLSLRALPYDGGAIYPVVYVIGQYCGWTFDSAQKLSSFSGDEENYEGLIGFGSNAASGFKVSGTNGWSTDYGNWGLNPDDEAPAAEASSVTLWNDGGSGNITCYSHKFYHFGFNKTTLVLTKNKSFDVMGICGDMTNWKEGLDIPMEFDTETQRFYADVTVTSDGGFKFRADGDWGNGYNLGLVDGKLGNSDSSGNISITAGNYRIYLDLNNSASMSYEISADDYEGE